MNKEQKEIVKLIVDDPAYIKPTGKANINALACDLGKSWNDVSKIIKEIARRLENEL